MRFARRCSTSPDGERTIDRAWTTREMLATLSADADLLAAARARGSRVRRGVVRRRGRSAAADWDVARARCEAVRRVARARRRRSGAVTRPPLSACSCSIAATLHPGGHLRRGGDATERSDQSVVALRRNARHPRAVHMVLPPRSRRQPDQRHASTCTGVTSSSATTRRFRSTVVRRQRHAVVPSIAGAISSSRCRPAASPTPRHCSAASVSNPRCVRGAGIATVAQPFDSTDRVRSVPVGAGLTFTDQQPLVPMLVEHRRGVAGVVRVGSGRAYVLGDTAAALQRRAPPRRFGVPRAQPAAACSRRTDQLRRVSPRRDQRHRAAPRRSSTGPSDVAALLVDARGAADARAQRPASRQAGAGRRLRRRCRAPPRT